jgi:hypothetical protein
MSTIVKFALREVITNENLNLSVNTRNEALDELIQMERNEARNTGDSDPVRWHGHMQEFRQHRANNSGGRIGTIKLVRQVLNCGLSEALIIVKGIETQDGIV